MEITSRIHHPQYRIDGDRRSTDHRFRSRILRPWILPPSSSIFAKIYYSSLSKKIIGMKWTKQLK